MADFMQGLMGMFTPGAEGIGELLGEEERKRIANQALMTTAMKLLASSGRSAQPVSLGQALGGAYLTGQEAMNQGVTNAAQNLLLRQKLDEAKSAAEDKTAWRDFTTMSVAATPTAQNFLATLSPEQRAILGRMGPTKGSEKLLEMMNLGQEWSKPEPVMRNGKLVMESRNKLGQTRIDQGAAPYERPSAALEEYQFAQDQGFKGSLRDWKATDPTAWQEFLLAKSPQGGGFTGSFGDWKKISATTIKLPPQQTAEQTARGGMLVKDYEAVSGQAKAAVKALPAIESAMQQLDKGFETGFGADAQATAASVLAKLGVPEAKQYATNAQTFKSATNDIVLQKQLEQKGTQTKSDTDRIQSTTAQLGNTTEANKFLLSVAKAQLKRDMDQRAFYDSWWKTNKTYDGAEDAWFNSEGSKSLFDRPELNAYKPRESAPIPTAPPAPATPARAAPRSAAAASQVYADPEKERRYQEFKRSQQR